MEKIDRIRELEKIAEKLGIGQNREVKCVACKRKIKFRDAVVLTNKKKVTYLCKDCYKKLEKGELDKKQIETNEILKEIEKLRKLPDIQPVPYTPKPIPWKYEPVKWEPPYTPLTTMDKATIGGDYTSYSVHSMKNILKFESNHGHKTNSITRR